MIFAAALPPPNGLGDYPQNGVMPCAAARTFLATNEIHCLSSVKPFSCVSNFEQTTKIEDAISVAYLGEEGKGYESSEDT